MMYMKCFQKLGKGCLIFVDVLNNYRHVCIKITRILSSHSNYGDCTHICGPMKLLLQTYLVPTRDSLP